MKKRRLFTYLVLFSLLTITFSCELLNIENKTYPCKSFVPASHKFGRYVVNVKANKPTLQIGDTVFLSLKVNQQFYDSVSRQAIKVNDKVALLIKISSASSSNSNGGPFAIDTTIYRVFDKYFITRVLKGNRKDPYLFECNLKDGFWELDLQYIALKKGKYDLYASFKQIQTGEPALPKGVCMLGDPKAFGARISLNMLNNQVNRIYPNLSSLSYDLFGFIVE
jgi:hypothetical protein